MAQLVSHTSGTDMTISAYVKSNVVSDQSFKLFGDYATGSGTSGTLTATSEWQRFTFTFTPTATGSRNAGILNVANTAADLLVYAMQIETGSYPTSYIPCMGVSATRAKDVCNKTSATSIIGQTEGTIFIEGKINADNTDDYNRIFGISQGNDSYRIIIFSNNQKELSMNVKNAGNTEASITSTISPLSTFKAAIGYAANDFVFYVNGQQIGTDNSGSVPACHTISLGTHEDGSGTRVIEGGVNQALLFKTRLTNAELAALTTI